MAGALQASDFEWDVVGDVHGHNAKLESLLAHMGYSCTEGFWSHPQRRVLFAGDLVDRGPAQYATVTTARRMVEAGAARIVMGNHEYNALAYATPDPDEPGEYLRRHTEKNTAQHSVFLDAVGTDPHVGRYREVLDWFRTIPLWLDEQDLGGIRMIHACWDPASIEVLRPLVGPGNTLTHELLVASSRKGTAEYDALEMLLKGPEVALPDGLAYHDKEGHRRTKARFAWFERDPSTYGRGARIPSTYTLCTHGSGCEPEQAKESPPFPDLGDLPIEDPPVEPYTAAVPLFVGHYWRTVDPTSDHLAWPRLWAPEVACVDYSAAIDDAPLVAYRWSGEPVLTDTHFVMSTDWSGEPVLDGSDGASALDAIG